MKIYLLDDSPNILNILGIIIRERNLGAVCGSAGSGEDALEDLPVLQPDLIVVDLLMPDMDGITFVQKARPILPHAAFIMLSQVSSKEMIAAAYESGIQFFIQKPVNSIEVETVLRNVSSGLHLQNTLSQMHSLMETLTPRPAAAAPAAAEPTAEASRQTRQRAEDLLRRIGILGENGSRDLIALVCHLALCPQDQFLSLTELCGKISDSPKTVEQRIRRAATAGLACLANLGIEDYANEVFTEYAGALYGFDQVRREMDCIRGKCDQHGRVQIKRLISALVSYCAEPENS